MLGAAVRIAARVRCPPSGPSGFPLRKARRLGRRAAYRRRVNVIDPCDARALFFDHVRDPARRLRVQALALRARSLRPALTRLGFTVEDCAQLEAACWACEIGHSPTVAVTGFAPLDGARFYAERGQGELASLIAWQGRSAQHAPGRLLVELARFPAADQRVLSMLDMLSMTTGEYGRRLTARRRTRQIAGRHGRSSEQARAARSLEAQAVRTQAQIKEAIAELPVRAGILLDLGGVLFEDSLSRDAYRRLARRLGINPAVTLGFRDRVREPLWTGEMSEDQFWAEFSELAGEDAELVSEWQERVRSPQPLGTVARVGELAAAADLCVLSNHRHEWIGPALKRSGVAGACEQLLISSEIGVCKPESSAFRLARDCFVDGWPVMFVDDQQSNLDAARARGFQTLLADPAGRWVDQALRWAAAPASEPPRRRFGRRR